MCVAFMYCNINYILMVTDEHLVTGDSSSIDNMLVEENSMDNCGNTSNALKYVCLVYIYIYIYIHANNTQIVICVYTYNILTHYAQCC